MTITMLIGVLLIAISFISALAHSEDDNYAWICFVVLAIGIIILVSSSMEVGRNQAQHTRLKLKELKENTILMIKDSTNLYSEGDTIKVNMETMKISTDSNSVKCVVLKLKEK